jgi:hypothetical protein
MLERYTFVQNALFLQPLVLQQFFLQSFLHFILQYFLQHLRQPFVENPILEKVRSGGSGQTFALPTKKKVSEQMQVASAPTYASILKKGLKWARVTVHSF